MPIVTVEINVNVLLINAYVDQNAKQNNVVLKIKFLVVNVVNPEVVSVQPRKTVAVVTVLKKYPSSVVQTANVEITVSVQPKKTAVNDLNIFL